MTKPVDPAALGEQGTEKFPARMGMRAHFEVIEFKRRDPAPSTRAEGDAGAAADAAAAQEQATYDVVISSEWPCSGPFGTEILAHDRSAIDLSYAKNGLSLLAEHGKSANTTYGGVDPLLHIGIVEDIKLDEAARKLRGVARFSDSALAQQCERDVQNGIRPFISVGWKPIKVKQTKVASEPGDVSEYLFTRWQPREVSIVSTPADARAQFGRSAADEEFPVEMEVAATTTPAAEVVTMEKPQGEQPTPSPAAGSPSASAAVLEATTTAIKDRNEEISRIIEVLEANNLQERTAETLRAGKSYADVCKDILELRKSETRRPTASEALQDIPNRDRLKYRYNKAIRSLLRGEKLDGVERDVHELLDKNVPEGVERRGGLLVPLSIADPLQTGEDDLKLRTMVSNVANKGADLVFDQKGELIEILRNTAVLSRLGAQFLTGLSGPITFPKQSGDVTVFWVGENPASDTTTSDLDIDTVLMQPKTLIGATTLSRQLIMQTSGVADNLVRQSLGIGSGLAIDRGGLHGTGAAGQVTGVYVYPDVQTQAMGSVAPTWPNIATMIGQVADKNALLGSLGFTTTAILGAFLLSKLMASNVSGFIWQGPLDDGRIGGYRALASTQVLKTLGAGSNEHGFVFGNWADMLVGQWGALELIVDEVTLKKKGLIEVASFQMADVIIRHGESFSKGTAAQPA